jgi:hypothetical protein
MILKDPNNIPTSVVIIYMKCTKDIQIKTTRKGDIMKILGNPLGSMATQPIPLQAAQIEQSINLCSKPTQEPNSIQCTGVSSYTVRVAQRIIFLTICECTHIEKQQ